MSTTVNNNNLQFILEEETRGYSSGKSTVWHDQSDGSYYRVSFVTIGSGDGDIVTEETMIFACDDRGSVLNWSPLMETRNQAKTIEEQKNMLKEYLSKQ